MRLKSLKVIPVFNNEINKYPQATWYLVSDSNSVPIKEFTYGMRIQGMRPAYKDTHADPLEPGLKYRLLVEDGNQKIQHDFIPEPRTE